MRHVMEDRPLNYVSVEYVVKSNEINKEIYARLRKISKRLKKEYSAQEVILFGSYATGNATKDSDVDLFIIASTKERFFERMVTVKRIIRDLRNGFPVSPIVLNKITGLLTIRRHRDINKRK